MALSFAPLVATAYEPRGIIQVGFGSYQIDSENVSTQGQSTRLGLKYLFHENYAWNFHLETGQSKGNYKNEGSSTDWDADESHLEVGGTFEMRTQVSEDYEIEPFVGLGLNAQSYQYDITVPGTQTASTSGVGWGPSAVIGARFGIGKNFVIIPQYFFKAISVKSMEVGEEEDEQEFISQTGVNLVLVLRF